MDASAGENSQAGDNKEMTDLTTHFQVFDEPDDELEEFDEIGALAPPIISENIITVDDPEIADWNEDWETAGRRAASAGWDDEDTESEFVKKILQELENYRRSQAAN